MNKILNNISKASVIATTLGLLLMAAPVGAHQDPALCDSTGVGISITTLRSDGTTPVGAGSVQSGETIKYKTTLTWAGGSNCNFEGGAVTITTPDGIVNAVGNPGLVSSGFPFVSSLATYVVNESNVIGGFLSASTNYTGGTSHLGDGNHPPVNAGTGTATLYQDVALEVTKTATPAFDRTHSWTIDKSVDVLVHNLLTGNNGTSNYDVLVTKTTEDSNFSVSGTITIHNPALFADAVITSVSDVLSIDGVAVVDCDPPAAVFPYNLAAGADLVCTYSASLADSSTQTNTATATTSGDVGGDSGDAAVDFTGVNPTVNGFNTINVNDSVQGVLGSTDVTHTFEYAREFTCDADEGNHPNIATIIETQQSDDALVTVNCVDPLVIEKTAETSYTRDWDWTINKSADQTDLLLAEGESFTVNYEVEVIPSSEDINHAVTGTITVTNPVGNPDATIEDIDDVLNASGDATTLNCEDENVDTTFPFTLSAGEVLTCTYTKNGASTNDNLNTATVITSGSVPGGSDTANVVWGQPNNITDECVLVSDNNPNGPQNVQICENDVDKTIEYSVIFGPDTNPEVDVITACDDDFIHPNIADFVTNDNQEVGQDNWNVHVVVDCFQGCTLTQGYWKTHSSYGPAPYDTNWQLLPGDLEGDTLFFDSGKTWYEVFWTAPKGGNAYIQLAHQYMAAVLNKLNDASTTPAVDAAISGAEALFNAQGAGDMTLTKPETTQARNYAGTLGSYNEGLIGPGHCDEQNPPL